MKKIRTNLFTKGTAHFRIVTPILLAILLSAAFLTPLHAQLIRPGFEWNMEQFIAKHVL